MHNMDQTKKYVEKVAAVKGWILNPDKEFTQGVIEGLCNNEKKLGCFLCPCRESSGKKERDRDIVCPCAYAQEDIQEFGHCYCALFLAPEFAATKKEPQSIPERRNQ